MVFSTFLVSIGQGAYQIRVNPSELTLKVDEVKTIQAVVVDDQESYVTSREILYFGTPEVSVDSLGNVTAHRPGEHQIIIISPDPQGAVLRTSYLVKVEYPPLSRIEIREMPQKIYSGTTFPVAIEVFDEKGFQREDITVVLTSSDPEIIDFDELHNLSALKPGNCVIQATAQGISTSMTLTVVKNPVVDLKISADKQQARTGDVIQIRGQAFDDKGNEVVDIPLFYSFEGRSFDISSSAGGLIKQDGRFVAEVPGHYQVAVNSGSKAARLSLKILPRNVARNIEVVGSGVVSDKHTSDLWIWEGVDGRDYAVTGTWGADGTAYFWDVTDPANIERVDSIQVDARTVNDVKVSADGKICVISREGASNRKNGIVILDVTNPREVKTISTFTENLTGGVHNLFIYQNHVYALSGGQKYYVIDIKNPAQPEIVGKFELDTPGHAIHDVWVTDGIAYSSNWQDGVQLVDVGNGIAGGSPSNPVQFAAYKYPSGAHHATFPFTSPSTGKFYTVLGDEIFPYGLNTNGPNMAGGFLHFVDFTDLDHPEEVARYELPGAGSHNFWIEDETLYVAYYNGGVRVVDISGELMGDLYRQGREIAFIIPSDPKAYIANSPFTWGAQLHKGHIFYSDWNSGLWSAKLAPVTPDETKIETD
ncbi:MAG: hypothetical protein DHS20C17_11710 [Cyclobacteriaceae bacterium]|nr:MAG: hypothetical protein DHS20C17_11710 [Cyclobacteriaceae bacterium]